MQKAKSDASKKGARALSSKKERMTIDPEEMSHRTTRSASSSGASEATDECEESVGHEEGDDEQPRKRLKGTHDI